MVNTKIQAWRTRLTHESDDEQFAQKQEEICHFVQDSHPKGLKRIIYSLQKKRNWQTNNRENKEKKFENYTCAKYHIDSPDHVPHEEEEGISGRGAKVFAINCHLEAKHIIQIKWFNITNSQFVFWLCAEGSERTKYTTYHNVGISV